MIDVKEVLHVSFLISKSWELF